MRTSLIYHRVAMEAEQLPPYESPKLRGLRGELKQVLATRETKRAELAEIETRVKHLDSEISERKAYEARP